MSEFASVNLDIFYLSFFLYSFLFLLCILNWDKVIYATSQVIYHDYGHIVT